MCEDVEKLAAKIHEVYQIEAKRQGDVRHADKYSDLPENVKEFDRVLARHVLRAMDKVLWRNNRVRLVRYMLTGK